MIKKFTMYQVDAFAEEVFSGNPAAVIVSDQLPNDEIKQKIAGENNLSETAFVCPLPVGYEIRWFTPTHEVDLCGHATLAAAYVIFNFFEPDADEVVFESPRSGKLLVQKQNNLLAMDFPADLPIELPWENGSQKMFSAIPNRVFRGKDDFMMVFNSQLEIESIVPDFRALAQIEARGIIVTAPGNDVDFVSRFFAPRVGINEDPVTGSAHTLLTPYWSQRLQKNTLTALQISERGGRLICENNGNRVKISGKAKLYLQGEIFI